MTPSIKALAIEAGMYVDVDGKPWPKWMGAEDCEKAYAKFAELIVRECGDVAYKAYWDNPETARGIHIQEKIKQHFGVEE
jgi:hypothetical protein